MFSTSLGLDLWGYKVFLKFMGVATAYKKSLKCKYIVCSNDYTVDLSYDCNVPKKIQNKL